MPPIVSIILVNYNNWKDTIECLESIYRSGYTNYNVILVDNNSADNSIYNIKEWALGRESINIENNYFIERKIKNSIIKPIEFEILDNSFNVRDKEHFFNNLKLSIITLDNNTGFAGGNNIGMRYMQYKNESKYIWILNNDTVIDVMSLGNQVDFMEKEDGSILLGSKINYYDNPNIIQSNGGRLNPFTMVTKHQGNGKEYDQIRIFNDPDYIPGTSMFFNKKLINRIGFIPEEYFMYGEDVDWSLRAKAFGVKLKICNNSILWHKEGASLQYDRKSNQKPELSDHLSVVNRLIIAKKYFPNRIIFVYAGILVSIIRRLLRGQPNRSLKIIKHIFSSIL